MAFRLLAQCCQGASRGYPGTCIDNRQFTPKVLRRRQHPGEPCTRNRPRMSANRTLPVFWALPERRNIDFSQRGNRTRHLGQYVAK